MEKEASQICKIESTLVYYSKAHLIYGKVPMGERGKITEIPISEDVKNMTAAEAMYNHPKFPLLKGEENHQIIRQLIELTKEGKIVWYKSNDPRNNVLAYANYLGLLLYLYYQNPLDLSWGCPESVTFEVYNSYKKGQEHLTSLCVNKESKSDFKKLGRTVLESISNHRGSNSNPLDFIWNVLILR